MEKITVCLQDKKLQLHQLNHGNAPLNEINEELACFIKRVLSEATDLDSDVSPYTPDANRSFLADLNAVI